MIKRKLKSSHEYMTKFSIKKFLFNYRSYSLKQIEKADTSHCKLQNANLKLLAEQYANNMNTQDLNKLLISANKIIELPIISIVKRESKAPSKNPKDYLSYAPYYWLNQTKNTQPCTKAGVKPEYRDGRSNPELLNKSDKPKLAQVCARLHLLALAYNNEANEAYLNYYFKQLNTWFINPETSMSPHMQFSQIKPWTGAKAGFGIIDSRWIILMIDSLLIMQNTRKIDNYTLKLIGDWLKQLATWLLSSYSGLTELARKNNRGSWIDVLLVYISLYLNEDSIAQKIISFTLNNRPQEQVNEHGQQPLELMRYTAVSYSLYNIYPVLYLYKFRHFYQQQDIAIPLKNEELLHKLQNNLSELYHLISHHEKGAIENIEFTHKFNLNLYYPYSFEQMRCFPSVLPFIKTKTPAN